MKNENFYVEIYDSERGDSIYNKCKYFATRGAAERYAKRASMKASDTEYTYLYILNYCGDGCGLRLEFWQGKRDIYGDTIVG